MTVHDYYLRQLQQPYRSTVQFTNWLEKNNLLLANQKILDLGTGLGQALFYVAQRHPNIHFTGGDIQADLIAKGKEILPEIGIKNVELAVTDLYKLPQNFKNQFDGILSMGTLSWLPDFREPIQSMLSLRPKWLAISSLFYDGLVNCRIRVEEYLQGPDAKPLENFYNIYSLGLLEDLLKKEGYSLEFEPFHIDTDLPKIDTPFMRTHTVTTQQGTRMQMSGPVWMNWYFVLAKRT